jgi:prepilin-type N-terminal cleavage/methylation domain-containing protein
MRNKAFTLIELLVVIAIIAILAAILFPVFAQAKVAAKKAAAISNQKQIGLSIVMYAADYDDLYPRNDDCQPGTSLNGALNSRPYNPTGPGCTSPPFQYRMNHYSWQKWVMPYMKNVDIFEHPGRRRIDASSWACPTGQWSDCGQIMGGFSLNLALTGALNTYNASPGSRGQKRNSFLGGTQTSIPDVAGAMLLFEFGHPTINFAPPIAENAASDDPTYTVYPPAVREWWARNLMEWDVCTAWDMSEIYNEPDPMATIGGGIVLGFADGHAKFYQAQKFLAETPTMAEYVVGGSLPSSRMCGYSSGTFAWDADVDTSIDYPLWGLGGF